MQPPPQGIVTQVENHCSKPKKTISKDENGIKWDLCAEQILPTAVRLQLM